VNEEEAFIHRHEKTHGGIAKPLNCEICFRYWVLIGLRYDRRDITERADA